LNSVNFVLLGDSSLGAQLGKKGTATDLVIYDRKTADTVYTWTSPVTYPDKIQPLMQAVSIGEYAILNVDKLDKFLGEQVMSLDAAGPRAGFVLHGYSVDREKLKSLLKSTEISNYEFLDNIDSLKAEMAALKPIAGAGKAVVVIDHAFDVKGVGTVALGVVRKGAIKAYDNLVLLPSGKSAMIKSIQMHDDPVQEASSPARVGLALKGVTADEISRGDVLAQPEGAEPGVKASGNSISIDFVKSPFFKGDLPDTHTYLISVGAQIRSAKIKHTGVKGEKGELLEISIEKPIAVESAQNCVLLKPDSPSTRIVGRGPIR
jgi:selenocysteine-specific translation elongation factor